MHEKTRCKIRPPRSAAIQCYSCRSDDTAVQGTKETEQALRRQELQQYLELAKERQGQEGNAEGQPRFGIEFYNLVQRLSQEQKAEYSSIRGNACGARSHLCQHDRGCCHAICDAGIKAPG